MRDHGVGELVGAGGAAEVAGAHGAVGEDATCHLTLKRLWCGRTITPDEAGQLLRDKRTDLLAGFRGKSGRPFKAHIVVSDEGRVGFDFPEKKGRQARTNTRSKKGGK